MTMLERVARAMYWARVNPDLGHVTLDVAVMSWGDLPETHEFGLQIWQTKSFWREAARAAIEAMREPTEKMIGAGVTEMPALWSWRDDACQAVVRIYRATINVALAESKG